MREIFEILLNPFTKRENEVTLETDCDLGDGSFSQVYRGTRLTRRNQLKPCAIKVMSVFSIFFSLLNQKLMKVKKLIDSNRPHAAGHEYA